MDSATKSESLTYFIRSVSSCEYETCARSPANFFNQNIKMPENPDLGGKSAFSEISDSVMILATNGLAARATDLNMPGFCREFRGGANYDVFGPLVFWAPARPRPRPRPHGPAHGPWLHGPAPWSSPWSFAPWPGPWPLAPWSGPLVRPHGPGPRIGLERIPALQW